MPQLLLELFSEEIPARMQAQAARDLERMARERLAEAGYLPEALKTFAGPRRLTLVAEGLPPSQADRTEERKGPKVGAPQAALDGFLRTTGLSQDQLTQRDGVWFAVTAKPGRPTPEVIAEMVPAIIRAFPWPKSMKWGTGALRWVRPLQRILCVFDGEIVPFEIEGIQSGDMTEGHRFMGSRAPFRARHFEAYAAGLEANFVVLDPEERKARILEGAKTLCFARGVELVDDQGLLDEVAGLAEWPTPILGDMDPAFLDLPAEVIRTSMRTHQKYFAVRDPKTGALAPNFLVVANIEARDGGHLVAIGNARVLSARLNDARFFWDNDRKTPLQDRLEALKNVTFHAKLGTLYQRAERISALAAQIAPLVGADPVQAARAGLLAKADLSCGMVGEFPELQGLMGGYYARQQGEPDAVADAIRDHYKPQGPGDSVPTAPVSVAVALAEKLDTLVGFFTISEKPTGSKDPYALRRAALGVLRLLITNHVNVSLNQLLRYSSAGLVIFGGAIQEYARLAERFDPFRDKDNTLGWSMPPISNWLNFDGLVELHGEKISNAQAGFPDEDWHNQSAADEQVFRESKGWYAELVRRLDILETVSMLSEFDDLSSPKQETKIANAAQGLLERMPEFFNYLDGVSRFFEDRLKVQLREDGKRHDLLDAVFFLRDDDMVRLVDRVECLDLFLKTDDGRNLLAGFKRAANVLKIEEKNASLPEGAPVHLDGAPDEETALLKALTKIQPRVETALASENYNEAMTALAGLRGPVDAFFDKVFVNDPIIAVRDNRLRLLTSVRAIMERVADFNLING